MAQPLRLDFFGDTLESIRSFDPESQRTIAQVRGLDLVPMSEVTLTSETMARFRQNYVQQFGGQTRGDALYEAISEGRRHAGMEHWLPLFHDGLSTLFDYLNDPIITLDHAADEAATARQEQVQEFYTARREGYLDQASWARTHLVIGYITLAATYLGVGSIVF